MPKSPEKHAEPSFFGKAWHLAENVDFGLSNYIPRRLVRSMQHSNAKHGGTDGGTCGESFL
jgi:hypothetical protein